MTPAQCNYLARFASGRDRSIALGLVLAESGVPDPAPHFAEGYERIIDDLYSFSRAMGCANWRFG